MNLVWISICETLKLKAICRVALRLLRYDHWTTSSLVLAPADQPKLLYWGQSEATRRSAKYRKLHDVNGELHSGSPCSA
jgi:hypothetical protein